MTFEVVTKHSTHIYRDVRRVTIDTEGNLRLFRKRGSWRKTADVFHPAYEWLSVGRAKVEHERLMSPTERFRSSIELDQLAPSPMQTVVTR